LDKRSASAVQLPKSRHLSVAAIDEDRDQNWDIFNDLVETPSIRYRPTAAFGKEWLRDNKVPASSH
jgi:hypothetical protein